MTLSVVIPVWSGTPLLEDMAVKLCLSVANDCDELIVCEDGPASDVLRKACDTYIVQPERLGHPQNLWSGIMAAKHDFIGVLDFDIVIKSGSLRDLCVPGKFVSAHLLNPTTKTGFIIWCSVTEASLMRQYPMPDGNLLDNWADAIPVHLRQPSNAVNYEHHSGIGVAEWNRIHAL